MAIASRCPVCLALGVRLEPGRPLWGCPKCGEAWRSETFTQNLTRQTGRARAASEGDQQEHEHEEYTQHKSTQETTMGKNTKNTKGRGKHGKYPRDKNGETAVAYGKRMRAEYPLPDGGAVLMHFPDGPDRGTWDRSSGRFRAMHDGETIGTYDTYATARAQVINRVNGRTTLPGARGGRPKSSAMVAAKQTNGSPRQQPNPVAPVGSGEKIVVPDGCIDPDLFRELMRRSQEMLEKADALERSALALVRGSVS